MRLEKRDGDKNKRIYITEIFTYQTIIDIIIDKICICAIMTVAMEEPNLATLTNCVICFLACMEEPLYFLLLGRNT